MVQFSGGRSVFQKIVYRCRGEIGGFDLCSVNPDGSAFEFLTSDMTGDTAPKVSPNGRTIAWERDGADMFLMDIDGSNKRELLPDIISNFDSPTWSPDGELIAFICSDPNDFNADWICTVKPDGTEFDLVHEFAQRPTYLEWSPTNPAMLLMHIETQSVNEDIFTYNIVTGVETNVSNTGDEWEHGTWSPDGNTIAFVGTPLPDEPRSLVGLYKMDVDGSSRTHLFTSPQSATATSPSWSPAGNEIAYFCNSRSFCFVDPDGGLIREVTEPALDNFYLGAWPDWSFTSGPVFGDWNCDGVSNGADAEINLRHSSETLDENLCLAMGSGASLFGGPYMWGDADCDDDLDPFDALVLLLAQAGTPRSFPACPLPGRIANIRVPN